MNDVAIRVEGLGKLYRIGALQAQQRSPGELVSDVLSAPLRGLKRLRGRTNSRHEKIWALRDVSFEVKRGEVVGIIGRNGAGKTTLLKILSRITEPTEGRAAIRGQVGSLLEVGTGFHPELTGRENIYLSGAILGMKKAEIDRKFAEIVDFSGVEKFIDTPVKRYSSGMYVRLAFAVAAHLEPEILIVDEVLAVGDFAFQEKCIGRMDDLAERGRTVLFVSHNMAAINALCSSAYQLREGSIVDSGPPTEVTARYVASLDRPKGESLRHRPDDRHGDGRVRFTEICAEDKNGNPLSLVASGQEVRISLGYEVTNGASAENVLVAISFHAMHGQHLFYCENEMVGAPFRRIPLRGRISCSIPSFPLAPGQYYLNVWCRVNGIEADWIGRAHRLTVVPGDFYDSGRLPPVNEGPLLAPHRWTLERK